jgi:hypothetical protein
MYCFVRKYSAARIIIIIVIIIIVIIIIVSLRRYAINPLNAELNPTGHLLALLEARHILHVSGIRFNSNDTGVTKGISNYVNNV